MQKTIIRLLFIVLLFAAVWQALSRVDWMRILNIDQNRKRTEEKLGELFWGLIRETHREIHDKDIVAPVDTLLTRLCTENGISRKDFRLHLVQQGDINAMTLPGRHIVVFSGLMAYCENESELAGVLGHEVAHAEKNHIMKKLIKEIGLSVLISVTTGKGNPEILQEALKMLSSTAFDRALEEEADLAAVDMLLGSDMDPEPFADLLYRLSQQENQLARNLSWIMTHPDSEERAASILNYIENKKVQGKPALTGETWKTWKNRLNDVSE